MYNIGEVELRFLFEFLLEKNQRNLNAFSILTWFMKYVTIQCVCVCVCVFACVNVLILEGTISA